MGGPDPDSNARLRTAIIKARAEKLAKDNIDRAIKKGSGAMGASTVLRTTYEGYAPGGVAIIIDPLTRQQESNRGGCAQHADQARRHPLVRPDAFPIWSRPRVSLPMTLRKYSEDDILEARVGKNGAEDVATEDGTIEVTTSAADFANVLEAMQAAGLEQDSAEVEKIADTTVQLET